MQGDNFIIILLLEKLNSYFLYGAFLGRIVMLIGKMKCSPQGFEEWRQMWESRIKRTRYMEKRWGCNSMRKSELKSEQDEKRKSWERAGDLKKKASWGLLPVDQNSHWTISIMHRLFSWKKRQFGCALLSTYVWPLCLPPSFTTVSVMSTSQQMQYCLVTT